MSRRGGSFHLIKMTPDFTSQQRKHLRDALWDGYDDLLNLKNYGPLIDERRCQFVREMETPEELQVFAEAYNWDDGPNPLLEVIRHPQCDAGTAMMLYWLAAELFAWERSDLPGKDSRDFYDMAIKIEEQMQGCGFPIRRIRFDPQSETYYSHRSGLKRQIPQVMLTPTPGESFEFDVRQL